MAQTKTFTNKLAKIRYSTPSTEDEGYGDKCGFHPEYAEEGCPICEHEDDAIFRNKEGVY